MPRVGFNLSENTAQRVRELALRKTGSMKGLSLVAEEALKEYLDRHEKEFERNRNPCEATAFL